MFCFLCYKYGQLVGGPSRSNECLDQYIYTSIQFVLGFFYILYLFLTNGYPFILVAREDHYFI
jgi:hypothetical protein